MVSDLVLAISFTLAFICLVAIIFTSQKTLFTFLALGFFVFFYRANLLQGRADFTTILIFISGVLLLALELFIPSFGMIGIVGTILTVYSVFDAFDNKLTSFLVLLMTAAGIFISLSIFVRLGFEAKLFDRAILNQVQTKERGYNSKKDYSDLLGKKAITKTILRPTGVILVDKRPYDAKTFGEFIEKNKPVIISEIKDGYIIVKEIKEEDDAI